MTIPVNSFTKTYSRKTVLSFPGFTFHEKHIYAIIGANGSGKSTFARIAAGVLTPDAKASPFSNTDISIGYLPQKPFPFRMSLYRNLMLNGSGSKAVDVSRANHLLEALNLTQLSSANASQLSGGETARMALARLLMKDYRLLILDEPTAAMDIHSTLQAEALLKSYRETAGAAIILITHSLKQALRTADEVLFFREGILMEYGSAEGILVHPKKAETKEFLEFYGM